MHRTRAIEEQGPISGRSLTVTCQLCKQSGHTKRICPKNPSKGKKVETTKRKSDIATSTATANAALPLQVSLNKNQ